MSSAFCAAQYTEKINREGVHLPAKQCGRRARKGHLYCLKHGAHLEGVPHPKTPEHLEKMRAGLARWRETMNRAKAAGLIEDIPCGFQAGNKAGNKAAKKAAKERKINPPAPDKAIRSHGFLRAQKALVAEIASLPALPDKPFDQMEPHEQLTALTGLGMGMLHTVLTKPIDPAGTPLLFKAQMTAASTALSVRVKVDRNMLASKKADRLADLVLRLKNEGTVLEN